jgi:uncharacterized protein (DUF58 family)
MTFTGVRPYTPGDDIRALDWKVTARSGIPHIKQFVEERELTLLLIIDGSRSVLFGTQQRTKREYVAEIGAILAYAASYNQDKVGMMIFGNGIDHYVKPAKSRKHILRLIRDLLTHQPTGNTSNLAAALHSARQMLRQGTIIFIVSDFLFPVDSYAQSLKQLAHHHDITCMLIQDPLEDAIPDIGIVALQDMETAEVQWADTSSRDWQLQFQQRREHFSSDRRKLFQQAGIQELEINRGEDLIHALAKYFQSREHRRR